MRRGQGPRGELRLAPVRGQRPLHAGRERARGDQAGDHREALRRQLLDHRRRDHPRPELPAWRGRYVFGDFCRGVIQTAVLSRGARKPDRPQADGLAAVLVRRGRARPGLRDLARRPGLPFRAVTVITRILAPNPSPLTLTGTNTWVVGRDPAWVVDPGPAIESHLEAVAAEVAARGGAGGIALTHDHADHSEAIEPLRALIGAVPVARHGDGAARRRSTCSSSPATPTTTSSSSRMRRRSRATRCSARAACSSPGGCASTSRACGSCALWSWT